MSEPDSEKNYITQTVTCYKPGRSKLIVQEGVYRVRPFQKYSSLTFGPLSLISLLYQGKTKKDPLRVNCKAFLMLVGDGVGGLLGGDKAYRKLTLKQHPDR